MRQAIFAGRLGLISAFVLTGMLYSQPRNQQARPAIPKTWDEAALVDWATPVAGLNVRPGHFSAEEYYRARVDSYRTYPVYAADREPEGYWEMVQHAQPMPLIEPEAKDRPTGWKPGSVSLWNSTTSSCGATTKGDCRGSFVESDRA